MNTDLLTYPNPPLSDESIRLRPWTIDDLPAIEQASHDPYISDVTSVPPTYTDDAGRAFIERQWKKSNGISLCIADTYTDVALGFIGIRFENEAQDRASLGYWIVPQARGRSISAAAVQLLSEWAFSTHTIPRLELLVEPHNTASQRVAERAGFRREGLLRSYEEFKGRRADLIMYARIIDD